MQVFFTGPEEDQLFGRVLLGRGPLVGAAYPLYFRVGLQPSIVPGAGPNRPMQRQGLAWSPAAGTLEAGCRVAARMNTCCIALMISSADNTLGHLRALRVCCTLCAKELL